MSRRLSRALAAVLTTAVLIILTGAPAPSAAAADADCVVDGSVRNGAIFNQPHWESNGGDDKGALLSAHERGVDVKVMLDRV